MGPPRRGMAAATAGHRGPEARVVQPPGRDGSGRVDSRPTLSRPLKALLACEGTRPSWGWGERGEGAGWAGGLSSQGPRRVGPGDRSRTLSQGGPPALGVSSLSLSFFVFVSFLIEVLLRSTANVLEGRS